MQSVCLKRLPVVAEITTVICRMGSKNPTTNLTQSLAFKIESLYVINIRRKAVAVFTFSYNFAPLSVVSYVKSTVVMRVLASHKIFRIRMTDFRQYSVCLTE